MKNISRRSYQNKEIPNTDEESMLFERTPLHLLLSLRVWWLRFGLPAGGSRLSPARAPRERHRSCDHTHGVNRRSYVQVDPDPRPVKANVRSNEEPGTGAWSIVSVLEKQQKYSWSCKKRERQCFILAYRKDSSANLVHSLTNGPDRHVFADQLYCKSCDLIPGSSLVLLNSSSAQAPFRSVFGT